MPQEPTVSPTATPDTAPPKPAQPARPTKPTDARPLAADSVFGGRVADTANATKRAATVEVLDPEPDDEAPRASKGRKGKKGRAEPEPVVVTDKHRAAAAAAVRALEGVPKVVAARRYSTVFSAAQLEGIDAALTYSDAERELLIGPLAQGAAEHGLSLPWYAEFGIAAMMVTLPRFAMFSEFEKQAEVEWRKQHAGEPAPVKGEPS